MSAAVAELARAKINLALHVLGRRVDGYHELDSIAVFADIGDRLSFEPAGRFGIEATGPFAAALPALADNIIHAAWLALGDLFKANGRAVPAVTVRLEKILPVAAGIGGGSADAAATLRALLRLTDYQPAEDELRRVALGLGADVPVCLRQQACRMRGAGERMTPLAGFKPLQAVLINPGIAVATGDVFAALGLAAGQRHGAAIDDPAGAASWRNDLAAPACLVVPVISTVLAALARQKGVGYARMSGSGATCFAVFDDAEAATEAARRLAAGHPRWWVRPAVLG